MARYQAILMTYGGSKQLFLIPPDQLTKFQNLVQKAKPHGIDLEMIDVQMCQDSKELEAAVARQARALTAYFKYFVRCPRCNSSGKDVTAAEFNGGSGYKCFGCKHTWLKEQKQAATG